MCIVTRESWNLACESKDQTSLVCKTAPCIFLASNTLIIASSNPLRFIDFTFRKFGG